MNIKKAFRAAYPHIFPILLFFALEIQNAPDVFGNLPALFISCALLYVSIWMLFALTGRVFVSGLLASLALQIFYTANFYRQMQTGLVLLPFDLNLARHIGGVFAFSNLSVHWRPICSVICASALLVPLYHASKGIRPGIGRRAAIFIVSGVFMYISFFARVSQDSVLPALIVDASANASHNDIYREQGALLGFYTVFMAGDADEPAGYSREYMEALAAKVAGADAGADVGADAGDAGGAGGAGVGAAAPDGAAALPDVIIVMSESYWDPSRLPNVSYSEDAAPHLRALGGGSGGGSAANSPTATSATSATSATAAAATSGNVVPPVFGRMTCNTEYELLTGHSMVFAGNGDIPYYEKETYIERTGGHALAAMFKANGYRTVALHTYTASFFDRDEIYPMLGFDAFIAEEDMEDPSTKGSLRGREIVSDEYFCDMLINIVEDSPEPLFLFGVTVQNHTPYPPDKYEATRIRAESGGILSEEDTQCLESYLEGVYDADMVLGRLYSYIMASDRPAILLFFGDHLPILSQHTGIYTDLGYISEGEPDDLPLQDVYKMHTTPYVAFSNCAELPATWGDISPYFLGAVLADVAGIELNSYYRFLLQAFGRFSAMNQYLYVADGSIYGAPPDSDGDIMEMFAAFQYDRLFGEGYLGD